MKIAYLLSLGVLVGSVSMVGGAVVSADNVAAPVSTVAQTEQVDIEVLAKLSTQPTFSDSTLRRPL